MMGEKHSYGVVLDAGSSGTRVYVYEYKKASYVRAHKDDADELLKLPHIKTKKSWVYKVHPGISTFGPTPERVGEDHLKELAEFALDVVPAAEIENTPIFLLATAGMRLLPADQREAVLDYTCAYLRQKTRFQLPDCDLHIQVIPGETEGLYGWIAANYLLGGFDEPEKHDHGNGHHTYGFLDMGGASAQIAFAPNATEAEKHADDLKLLRLRKVNGAAVEYGVFVTTWLGFGANEARRRYVEHLLQAYPGERELPDPCLPTGILVDTSGVEIEKGSTQFNSIQPHLLGTGDFAQCLRSTYPLLEKEKACTNPPCLLNGVHTPAIDFDVNHFVGVSEYWHTTHEIFAMAHKDKAYDFRTYQTQVTEFCSRDWADIEKDVAKEAWGDKVDEKTVEEVCFKASWLINMLHDGIGIPRVGVETSKTAGGRYPNTTSAVLDSAKDRGFLDPFQAVNKIDGTEVSWTLGKMVLYASSQMPPAPDALAVGFGTNTPGSTALPSDFQRPSAEYQPNAGDPPTAHNLTTTQEDWPDRVLSSNYSHRLPGILIFLLILAVAIYLLAGRERRQTIQHKLLTLLHRRPSSSPRWSSYHQRRYSKPPTGLNSLSSKLLGASFSSPHDRLLEEADFPDDASTFELSPTNPYSSDTSTSFNPTATSLDRPPLRTGRSSGLMTPITRGMSPDLNRTLSTLSKTSASGGAGGSGNAAGGYFDALPAVTSASSSTSTPAVAGIGPGGGGGLGLLPRRPSSRPGSPRRGGSPLVFGGGSGGGGWKESVD